jgi:monoamine oxidase
MAGQAKAVVVYSTPFWREDGLSGDAQSRYGPMVEIHDASPARGGPYALFGFIGLPPQGRRDEGRLRKSICAQLERLFGPAAATPLELYVKDWAIDPYTSTELDKAPLYAHPTYRMPPALTDIWGGRLFFAGTEVAPEFGGYLEGALAAAEATLEALARQG